MHLLLWPIFRQSHPNFITVRIRNFGTTDKKSSHKIRHQKVQEHFFILAVYAHAPLGLRALLPGDVAACFSLHSLYIIFFYK